MKNSSDALIFDLIERRKRLYLATPEKDGRFVIYAAKKILQDKSSVREVRRAPYLLIEALFTIVDKNKKSVPFFLNEVQRRFLRVFEEKGTSRPYFILKGRQQGFTTLITAMQLCYAITKRNFSGFTMADCTDNVNAIFNDKAKTVYYRLPKIMRPHEKYNSKRELYFDKLNSTWRIACAGDQAGRSRTLEFAHFSEAAFFDCSISELQKSIGEALVKNAVVIYETTANGFNQAKDLWDGGSCENLFFEWWLTDEYRSDNLSILENVRDAWLESRLEYLKKIGLDDNQRAWYAEKYAGYLDKDAIKQEYPCSPEEAFVASGDQFFDKDKIIDRINQIKGKPPESTGEFSYVAHVAETVTLTEKRWTESSSGAIKIIIPPEENERYVLGADTAGEGGDYYTGVVERVSDFKTVAVLRVRRIDDDLYARQLYCLGETYNFALIAVEVNFSTAPIRELIKMEYPELYRRNDESGVSSFGFRTTSITRPLVLSYFKAAFREDPKMETNYETLLEMLSFVRGKSGKAEAEIGKHDDLVMAKSIAHYVALTTADRGIKREKGFLEGNFLLSEKKDHYSEW
ncbi:MAG: hypothetical protein IJS93_03330 [Clostridia bacterium]|nr:hypothetical protein [Clostridia bacterium]